MQVHYAGLLAMLALFSAAHAGKNDKMMTPATYEGHMARQSAGNAASALGRGLYLGPSHVVAGVVGGTTTGLKNLGRSKGDGEGSRATGAARLRSGMQEAGRSTVGNLGIAALYSGSAVQHAAKGVRRKMGQRSGRNEPQEGVKVKYSIDSKTLRNERKSVAKISKETLRYEAGMTAKNPRN